MKKIEKFKCNKCGKRLAKYCVQTVKMMLEYETLGKDSGESFDWSRGEVIGAEDFCEKCFNEVKS